MQRAGINWNNHISGLGAESVGFSIKPNRWFEIWSKTHMIKHRKHPTLRSKELKGEKKNKPSGIEKGETLGKKNIREWSALLVCKMQKAKGL